MKKIIIISLFQILNLALFAQKDSTVVLPLKVSHAEPLYIDLIRDLGARKGEREWNLGWGTENSDYINTNNGFIEYEFSPAHHLGLEVEVPVHFYQATPLKDDSVATPRNRIEGIKMATQFTFYVSEKNQTSMAVGYIHEFRLHSFYSIGNNSSLLKGNGFNPFFIVAKRFGKHIHTLMYTGAGVEKDFHETQSHFTYQLNTSIHYMLPAKHFIGIEINQELAHHHDEIVVRPQLKVVLGSNLAIGFVTGIPLHAAENSMSFLARIIYEPRVRK